MHEGFAPYCQVIVEVSSADVDRVFTYRIPNGMEIERGMRVTVPFGSRKIEGYVIALSGSAQIEPHRIRDVASVLEDYPAILPDLIDLAEWMRVQYHCRMVEALRLLIPAQMRGGRVQEKTALYARLNVLETEVSGYIEKQGRSQKRRQVLSLLHSRGGEMPVSEVSREIPGAREALKALSGQGVVALSARQVDRVPYVQMMPEKTPPPPLKPAQKTAVEEICHAIDHGGERFLLNGVTGSGKTEVYIGAVRHALSKGMGGIILVPEISLTPQMVNWFRARFGENAALLHSRLSAGERYDEWRRIRACQARVVIGARSAVFAPVERLGIIIVDEEHEQSYRSESRPRYDAREVAQWRCAREGAALVLGSATPSIASYMRAMPGVRPENRYLLLELPDRINGMPLPEVDLVDMRQELALGNRSVFSGALDSALKDCFSKGQQAMLLMNRRGHSTFVSCRACGHVMKCQTCDVSLTYHRNGERMRCHYCEAEEPVPRACPACGSGFIKFFGAGTQKVEQELRERYPAVKVLRMDVDTTREKDAHQKILDAFRRGEAQVLVGTQMIAKGLDFPNVTVVGIVAADMTLNLPDYRSPERTFQLITQMAGRAGRADAPGRVIVQSYDPEHYAVAMASVQDYRAFYTKEADRRRRSLYPPYTTLARLLVTGEDEGRVQKRAEALEQAMAEYFRQNPDLSKQVVQMRAMQAPLAFIKNKFRWQVFLKLYARGPSDQVLEKLSQLSVYEEGLSVDLEINPANMI